MNEKVILITGSTDGIGKQTALKLAQMGNHVILHGRDAKRGQAALEEIRKATRNDRVDFVPADLSSQREVRDLAPAVQKRYPHLDVLVSNAGIYMQERHLTVDGIETTFAVNHLAPFLLTHLLLDLLKKSAPARIVNVSSTTHKSITHIDFDNLQGEQHYDGYSEYALSKLGNVLFAYELAERLKGTRVTVNCLHSGAVNTKLLRAGFGNYGINPQEGAETSVYLASSPDVEGATGKYFVNERHERSSPLSYDEELRMKFWHLSEELTRLLDE